ncbi:YHYH protein [Flavobacterium algicola]|uniref:YHYH protein n=1 Tax=Flavobacterium algicola TaxID=556529 RepID=UPI001EFC9629|nr:YHYH protein [Flavobacterium algicola]MCG9793459.1 YHYH protein [Flavobacterium algicola]
MKKSLLLIFLIANLLRLSAHTVGHGTPLKEWNFTTDAPSIEADFLKSDKNNVWLIDRNHMIKTYPISDFSSEDQKYIKDTTAFIHSLNATQTITEPAFSYLNLALILFGGVLLSFSLIQLFKQKRIVHLSYGCIGAAILLFASCKNNNTNKTSILTTVPENDLTLMRAFFEKFEGVTTHSDDDFLYISSNGLPSHDMMVGITNWQQQVPINQNYTGTNSWAIPLHPKMAENPLSTKTNLLKGAIAVAVNGIPIFNPLNNRGEDTNAIGELDQWGGHCGRADDYHYHLPPLHLQDQVGKGNPIAYAMDGFPVYGEKTKQLDEYLGKLNKDGSYEYHTIKEYPYFIASMRGEVKLDPNTQAPENQVSPQPRTQELRPALKPLRGAKITNFTSLGTNAYELTYILDSKSYVIKYNWDNSDQYTYEFIYPNGTKKIENYKPRK